MSDLELGKKRAEELGLETPSKDIILARSEVYLAEGVHRLLGEGQSIYGHVKDGVPNWWGPHENNAFQDTHQALLIGIRPIVQESEERRLLREFVKACQKDDFGPIHFKDLTLSHVYSEAKRLLDKSE